VTLQRKVWSRITYSNFHNILSPKKLSNTGHHYTFIEGISKFYRMGIYGLLIFYPY
jgi:hypothetical protein